MNQKQEAFFQSLRGKRVAFIGAGVSHRECIELFCHYGALVTLCDRKPYVQAFGDYAQTLERLGVRLSLGEGYLNGLSNQDFIMRTPGFEYYTPALQQALRAGIRVSSEMELFFELCPCKKIAVTGSDGKTTTTTLIAQMLRAQGETVHLGGNLGRPLLPIVSQINSDEHAVIELSSFQLISMTASPEIAVVTNVTPNHLDHHKNMQEYIDAKRNILKFQTAQACAVLGWENETTRHMQTDVKGAVRWFSRKTELKNGGFLRADGMLCVAQEGVVEPIVHQREVALRGAHNLENLLAAMTAVWGLVSVEAMVHTARTFSGVEHRIEPVRTHCGVQWFNDSIATSPTRVIAGLRAFDQRLIVIAGGSDKGVSFEPLVPELLARVKVLILMGHTAEKIERAVCAHPEYQKSGLQLMRAENLEQAVQMAAQQAQPGDIVSLSPACASFDAYENFEARGRHFKALVCAL